MTETMALGCSGCYFDKDWALPALKQIQEHVARTLGLSPTEVGAADVKLPPTNTKSVLLAYTDGGDNWAH